MRHPEGTTPVPLGYRVVVFLIRLCCRLSRWQLDVQGYEHVPQRGGAILTWNHTSHLDFAVTVAFMGRATGRWVRFLALRELWDSRALGWVPRVGHCVPVDRASSTSRVEAFQEAIDAIESGDLIMLAPEGTISESFELLPFRTGAVRMAQATGAPIIPTVSWGIHRAVTTGRRPSLRRAWRLPVVIRYGKPMYVAPDEDVTEANDLLRARVQGLLDEVRREYPGGNPAGAWWVPASLGGGAPTAAEVLARYTAGQALTRSRWAKDEQPDESDRRTA